MNHLILKRLIVLYFFLIGAFTIIAHPNKPYPTDYFRVPVEGEVRLSGTYGELRSNHFHSGIDIKGYRGRPILAAAEGFVYRISVRAGGYGNALYVKHPNGYVTLYGHLNAFTPEIAAYVKQYQYEHKTFEVDIKPDATLFMLKKGERIGTMGNSGYSFGPHLHFEIREANSDDPINPLLFGIKVQDTRAPLMNQVRIFGLNKEVLTTTTTTQNLVSKGRARYGTSKDTVLVAANRVGVAVKTYDLMDAIRNWNGVYKIIMLVDGVKQYEFSAQRFAFAEWQYLNAHVDYEDVLKNKSYFNRCFVLPGNHFSGYKRIEGDGIVELNEKKARRVEIISSDFNGNKSTMRLWLKKAPGPVKTNKETYDYYLPQQQENQINNYYLYLKFPKDVFYEDLKMNYHFDQEEGPNLFSTVHSLHDRFTPIHKSFSIAIRPGLIPENLKDKAIIAKCDDSNRIANCGGKWEGDRLWTKVSSFGDYAVMIDTIAPTIKAEDFRSDLRGRKSINFKAKDDLGTSGNARGLRYKATIDGKWVLLSYDLKYSRFTHRFDNLSSGEHVFRMEIIDDRDNVAVFEKTFLY